MQLLEEHHNRTLSILTAGSASCCSSSSRWKTFISILMAQILQLGIMQKAYYAINDTFAPYLAVAGDQLICSTNNNPFTVNLPATPSVGDEVTIIDGLATFCY